MPIHGVVLAALFVLVLLLTGRLNRSEVFVVCMIVLGAVVLLGVWA
jgi:hypothetical protein